MLYRIILLLLALAACDAPDDVEPRILAVAVADVESVDYGRKVLDACFKGPNVAELRLLADEPVDGVRAFEFTITSSAPAEQVDCAMDIVTAWGQP